MQWWVRWRRRSGTEHDSSPRTDAPTDAREAIVDADRAEGTSAGPSGGDGSNAEVNAEVGDEPGADGLEPGVCDLVENAELVIARLGPHVDFPFGWDRRSLVWVEGFLERQRRDPAVDAEALVSVLGSFLGQCLIFAGGGSWAERPEGWCLSSPRIDAFPFAKVEKQARYGVVGGESIVSFYDLTLEIAYSPFPCEGGARA